MAKDAKAADRQRLAEALRANLRRRKAARGARAAPPADSDIDTPQERCTPRLAADGDE
jgi:hypothetical protein